MAGKSSRGAMRHLELKGQTWWFRREVPPACRAQEGLKVYKVNLLTSDVRTAKLRRDELERECGQRWDDMKAGRWAPAAATTPAQRGSMWRETLAELRASHPRPVAKRGRPTPWEELTPEEQAEIKEELRNDPVEAAVDAEVLERERLRGSDLMAYEDALFGRVPVGHYLDAYLNAVKLVPASKAERRGIILRFARWAAEDGKTLSAITRRVAGRYVEALVEMHPVTRAKHLTTLRGYWAYLHQRGLIEGGDRKGAPWTEQELPNRSGRVERGEEERERPFTADEVTILLTAPWPAKMDSAHRAQVVDALRISLLSGLRLGEVVNLRVSDVNGESLTVRAGKTKAALRRVPRHPDLAEVITRRTDRKGPDALLFHELAEERDPEDACGKRFRRYRERLGVQDDAEGVRRSRVNFHSARRWFITQARHAGHSREDVADVVGHKPEKGDITFGVYNPEGASWEQRRAVVESVRLPTEMA